MNPIRQFELVIKVAHYGSVSRAADELHVAQPTLSKYIANIESQLGIELFDRSTLPIRLTAAGEKYVNAGHKIVDIHRQMKRELDEIKNDRQAVIVVGCSPTRATYMLPEILTEFRKLNKNAKVIVRERTTRQLNEELLLGELDLIISLFTDTTRQFEKVELFNESVLLAVPGAVANSDPMEIIRKCPVVSTGANLRLGRLLSEMLEDINVSAPSVEVQSIESALALVNAGHGVMIVPSYLSEYCKKENIVFMRLPDRVYDLLGGELERNVCVFYRKRQFLTSSQMDFIAACQSAIAK